MTTAVGARLFVKEVRALTPVFLGTTAFIVVCGVSGIPALTWLGVVGYVAGTIALGSLVIGHEYACDTLGHVLAQPGARQRLLRVKMGALLALLAPLAATAAFVLAGVEAQFAGDEGNTRAAWQATLLLLPPLLAFGVAPWLSVLCGSPLAAGIFTLSTYAGFSSIVRVSVQLDLTGSGQLLGVRTLLPLAALVATGAAVGGWRAFARAEANGHQPRIAAFLHRERASVTTVRPRMAYRPLRVLVIKELRLQQASLAVAALYIGAWGIVNGPASGSPVSAAVFGAITMLYRGLVAVLVGAVASAEERATGTLPLQMLQPYAIRRQWAVKVLVVLSLTLLLAGALPTLLDLLNPSINGSTWFGVTLFVRSGDYFMPRLNGYFVPRLNLAASSPVGLLLVLSVAALYVSTLCRTSLNALLVSIPFSSLLLALSFVAINGVTYVTASWLSVPEIFARFGRLATGHSDPALESWGFAIVTNPWWLRIPTTTAMVHTVIATGWFAPLLVLGLENHRTSLVDQRTWATQLGRFALWTVACGIAAGVFGPLQIWFLAKP